MAIDRDLVAETLSALIEIPSINPDLVPDANGEREIAEHIAVRLRNTPGIEVELQDAGQGRPNVIAIAGNGQGRTLMLNGHTDVVGVEGMQHPFEPRIEGDIIYGRGSCDMKAGLAAMILVLEEVARSGDLPGRIVATFVADEEYASIGTEAICREIERWQPAAAIVSEPTDPEIGIAHKGFIWATITTRGVAAHGSSFETGVDAIVHMGRVLRGLDLLGAELLDREPHPYVGVPSIHAALISGGLGISTYPDRCKLEIERRTIPGETVEQIRSELQNILDVLAREDPAFSAELEIGFTRQPSQIEEHAEIVRTVSNAVARDAGTAPNLAGSSGWDDSALLRAAGVPTVVWGPGGNGAHAAEEWGDLEILERYTRQLHSVAYDFCGGSD